MNSLEHLLLVCAFALILNSASNNNGQSLFAFGSEITVKLFTKESQLDPIRLDLEQNISSQVNQTGYCYLNPGKCSNYLIIHGYRSNDARMWILNMTMELFKNNANINVFTVNWASISNTINYFKVSKEKSFNKVNRRLIIMIENMLIENYLTTFNSTDGNGGLLLNLHCIGHSLGVHVCGSFGNLINSRLSMKLKRITGLDPAGPLFESAQEKSRLDKNDADFVDVIHTSSFFGIDIPIGHVDFYPNGGRSQPACSSAKCSHKTASLYFIESINSKDCKFTACECIYSLKNKYDRTNCELCSSKNYLGFYSFKPNQTATVYESSSANIKSTIYYLETNSNPPYCKS